jgi:hypothetical protein
MQSRPNHTAHSPLAFRKSSYSGARTENCVEVADVPGTTAVRDSQNRDRGHLDFPRDEWSALLGALRHR